MNSTIGKKIYETFERFNPIEKTKNMSENFLEKLAFTKIPLELKIDLDITENLQQAAQRSILILLFGLFILILFVFTLWYFFRNKRENEYYYNDSDEAFY